MQGLEKHKQKKKSNFKEQVCTRNWALLESDDLGEMVTGLL